MNSLLKAVTILDKTSEFHNEKVDILIESGLIINIDFNINNPKNFKEINLTNLHVSRGWFDSSVCFGEPGFENRETIENGLKTASRSGFTSVALQPNTSPVINNHLYCDLMYVCQVASSKFITRLIYMCVVTL